VNVGLWMPPAVLAGLALVLWVATRLEHLVTPPLSTPDYQIPGVVDTGFTDVTARPEALNVDGPLGAELASNPRAARRQLCTSD
jgi:hypothetical protein